MPRKPKEASLPLVSSPHANDEYETRLHRATSLALKLSGIRSVEWGQYGSVALEFMGVGETLNSTAEDIGRAIKERFVMPDGNPTTLLVEVCDSIYLHTAVPDQTRLVGIQVMRMCAMIWLSMQGMPVEPQSLTSMLSSMTGMDA